MIDASTIDVKSATEHTYRLVVESERILAELLLRQHALEAVLRDLNNYVETDNDYE